MEERRKLEIVDAEKQKLLREHMELLEQYYPKAAMQTKTMYGSQFPQ